MFWKRKHLRETSVEAILTNKILDRIRTEGCTVNNIRRSPSNAYRLCEWYVGDVRIVLDQHGYDGPPVATPYVAGQTLDLAHQYRRMIGEALHREFLLMLMRHYRREVEHQPPR